MLIFPDNTVLVKFAEIGRVDILSRMFTGHATWTASVRDECARSAEQPHLSDLGQVPSFMGDALFLEGAREWADMRTIREAFLKPGDGPTQHLGEAETLSIILNRHPSAIFVTDDKSAYRYATEHSLQCLTTWDVLKLAFRSAHIDFPTSWGYVLALGGNRQRYNELRNRDSFGVWCSHVAALEYLP